MASNSVAAWRDQLSSLENSRRRLDPNSDAARGLASDTVKIWRHLNDNHLRRWGFVIYRCTYASDSDWDAFMRVLRARTQERISGDKESDDVQQKVADALDMTVVQDPEELDGAGIEEIKQRFRAWRASDEARAELADADMHYITAHPSPGRAMELCSLRYQYCVHVDAEALNSVVRRAPHPPERDRNGDGYVNIVDSSTALQDERDNRQQYPEDIAEGVEDEDDKSWMRVAVDGLLPGAYAYLMAGLWHIAYTPPPNVWAR